MAEVPELANKTLPKRLLQLDVLRPLHTLQHAATETRK